MIDIKEKVNCCGCWACVNVCPKQCINMEVDVEGFHYPVVDKDNCIECGRCDSVCPLQKPKMHDEAIPQSFVVQNKDKDVLRNSTSGGFYTVLSTYVISNGGVVFGAAFDKNMVLRHSYSETLEGCKKFRGSKYVQSLIGNSFKQAKEFLDEGRMVAFSGTPCQIAGLVGYLGKKKYEKLILVDLVCRGVPSPGVLSRYLEYHAHGKNAKPIGWLSRDKYYGYDLSTATIQFNDNVSSYHGLMDEDLMLSAYFKGLISRPSCYECHFKTLHRLSDITIFDCWNAKDTSKRFSRQGATNVFIHTEKGKEIFDQIKESFIFSKSDINRTIKRDGIMIYNKAPYNDNRSRFFEDFSKGADVTCLMHSYCHVGIMKSLIVKFKPFLYKSGLWSLYMITKMQIRNFL